MKPFEKDLDSLIESGILKRHNGVNGEYIEYRLLQNSPNGKRERDHPEFELKTGRIGSQITLADVSDDYHKDSFFDTHAFNKCKSMVFIPRDVVDGKQVFCGFYHIDESKWESVQPDLENDFKLIREYILEHGMENLKRIACSNFVKETKYLVLYRCGDRIGHDGKLKKPAVRWKMKWTLMKQLMSNEA
jgi:hypothetical protein